MAKMVINAFTSYELTEAEVLMAQTLTAEQECYYRTMLSEYATHKLALKYDSKDHVRSVQLEAELQGQISLLQQILENHEEAIRLQTDAQENQQF